MKSKLSILTLLLVLVAGCAALGVPQADTFNKKVVAANAIVESAAGTIATLAGAGKISTEDAHKYLDQAKDAAHAIDVTREVYATNPGEAENRLGAIIVGLNALTALLEAKK